MVLCLVDIDKKTEQLQDFSDLGKCFLPRSCALDKILSYLTLLNEFNDLTTAEPVSICRRDQIDKFPQNRYPFHT